MKSAQKLFGYFDKSKLINLFENIFEGNESKVLSEYRMIYNQGIEPKAFLNDFLEMLYFFKNINSLKLDATNFSLDDDQFQAKKKISDRNLIKKH